MSCESHKIFHDSLERHIECASKLSDLFLVIEKSCEMIINAFSNNCKLIIAGNGGSASDAQHFTAELVGRFLSERRAFPALSLNTDGSVMTALSNDYGFETVFSRQLEAIAFEGDVFFAVSTSGRSKNILNAMDTARNRNLKVIGLSGLLPVNSPFRSLSDIVIEVTETSTPRIQEMHAFIIHAMCEIIEKKLF